MYQRQRLVIYTILLICAAFLLSGGILYVFQTNLIFYPSKLPEEHVYHFEVPFEEMDFYPTDEVRINAIFFEGNPDGDVVFYSHGNAGNLDGWGLIADQFTSLGLNVMIYDYRSYGKSTGNISESGLYDDALYLYDFLAARYGEERIVIYGRSIGTGIASKVASLREPKMLILESPYYSLPDLVGAIIPIVPRMLVRYRLPLHVYLREVACQVIIIHGDADEVIPVSQSVRLKSLLKQGDEVYFIQGGHHNDLDMFKSFHEVLKKHLL